VFLGFENTNFKPLSAQGERGQFPRVDGFSFGRWGCGRGGIYYIFVAEAVDISLLMTHWSSNKKCEKIEERGGGK